MTPNATIIIDVYEAAWMTGGRKVDSYVVSGGSPVDVDRIIAALQAAGFHSEQGGTADRGQRKGLSPAATSQPDASGAATDVGSPAGTPFTPEQEARVREIVVEREAARAVRSAADSAAAGRDLAAISRFVGLAIRSAGR